MREKKSNSDFRGLIWVSFLPHRTVKQVLVKTFGHCILYHTLSADFSCIGRVNVIVYAPNVPSFNFPETYRKEVTENLPNNVNRKKKKVGLLSMDFSVASGHLFGIC